MCDNLNLNLNSKTNEELIEIIQNIIKCKNNETNKKSEEDINYELEKIKQRYTNQINTFNKYGVNTVKLYKEYFDLKRRL
jgi:hypothetical protein